MLEERINQLRKETQDALLVLENENSSVGEFATFSSQTSLNHLINKNIIGNRNSQDMNLLNRIIDQRVILSLSRINSSSYAPLVLRNNDNCLDVGFAEERGTLWRLVSRPDALPGIRVRVCSAEFGLPVVYIGNDLSLTTDIEKSALWTVSKTIDPLNPRTDSYMTLRFELFDLPSNMNEGSGSRFLMGFRNYGEQGISLRSSISKPECESMDWDIYPDSSFSQYVDQQINDIFDSM